MSRTIALAVALLATAAPLSSQGSVHDIPRPQLDPTADTNDAAVYYRHGLERLERRPQEAAAAFHWASRLDPNWAEPLYARRIAILLSDSRRLVHYMEDDKRTLRSSEIQHADSLQLRALMLSPMLHRGLDRPLLHAYLAQHLKQRIQRHDPTANIDVNLLDYHVNSYLRTAPEMQAWMAYSSGRYGDAVEGYTQALKRARDPSELHAQLGRVFFLMGQHPKALESLSRAIETMRERDQKNVVVLYESKAVLEHGIGFIHEQMAQYDEAREAYGRALLEDLSYYPAHARLAMIALAQGDTTVALNELDLAVQLRQNEPSLRYTYGFALLTAAKLEPVAEQLQKAIELEPFYAAPYHLLGRIYDASGMRTEALERYESFLERASRRDPQRQWTEERVATLRSAATEVAP